MRGDDETISSVMPVSAVMKVGIGVPGFMNV